jgi:NitT/TauT family transport system permease protein
VATQLLEAPPPVSAAWESEVPASRRRAVAAAVAPVAATLLAWLGHLFLPNGEPVPMSWVDHLPAWRRPYPLFLSGGLVAALLLAAASCYGRKRRSWVWHYRPLLTAAPLLLFLWDLITLKLALLPLPYFPGPSLVLHALLDDYPLLLQSAAYSLRLLLCGYLTGVAAGLTSGVLLGWFREVRYWGMPIMKILGPIPATAFVPLALTLCPSAFLAGVLLIALAVWFPVTMLTMSGIMNAPAIYFDVARTLGARRGYLIFRVAIPAALPYIFLGLFMGLLTSFLVLIVAETVGVKAGLGWYLLWQQGYMEYAKVYASLTLMACFFSGLVTILFQARSRLLRWQKGIIRW